jgi:hypothetical protein
MRADLRCIVDLARERRDAECGELLGAGIGLEQAACGLAAQEVGFKSALAFSSHATASLMGVDSIAVILTAR